MAVGEVSNLVYLVGVHNMDVKNMIGNVMMVEVQVICMMIFYL